MNFCLKRSLSHWFLLAFSYVQLCYYQNLMKMFLLGWKQLGMKAKVVGDFEVLFGGSTFGQGCFPHSL